MTKIIRDISEWLSIRQQLANDLTLGFVPTMGNLHQGHVSLLARAQQENDLVILSIFVNPTQFDDPQDWRNYPHTITEDIATAEKLGIDYVFIPEASEIYPDEYQFKVSQTILSKNMENRYRAGHFDGVLTVVLKLFILIQPNRAYFSRKDYEQLYLIKNLASAFLTNIEIVACDTIREPSGLAKSSRNTRLSAAQMELAHRFAQIFHSDIPLATMSQQLQELDIKIEYLEEFDQHLHIAVYIGAVRLIDNRAIKSPQATT